LRLAGSRLYKSVLFSVFLSLILSLVPHLAVEELQVRVHHKLTFLGHDVAFEVEFVVL
jgi:hypothetical protein